jgi:hypothetical protein
MTGYWHFALLALCWLAALGILLFFLESLFAISSRNRFIGRRASGAYGPVSIFIPMKGSAEDLDRGLRSVLQQSYPFIELFLIYFEDDGRHSSLAREFRSIRSHIPVRLMPVSYPIEFASDRTRALERAQRSARGRWYVVLEPGVVLDRLAVEHSLEFAGSSEVAALSLRPGIRSRSRLQSLIAPSLEYFSEIVRVLDRRREHAVKVTPDASYLLVTRAAFDEVNSMNRMPGILNESGWNLWSFQLEGLRTFEGDGAKWMWHEVALTSWPTLDESGRKHLARSASLIIASALMSVTCVAGVTFGLVSDLRGFAYGSILAFSVTGYLLMTVGYFYYARRMSALSWFAPLWWVAHITAACVALLRIRHDARSSQIPPAVSGKSGVASPSRKAPKAQ